MPLGGWNPPGNEAPPERWQYDVGKGWSPPGHGTSKKGTQFTFHEGFDPAGTPKGFHLLASPPGTAAPIDAINYTPDTQEVHEQGSLAPVDKLNYSLIPPSRMRSPAQANPGPTPASGGVGVGQDFSVSDWNRGMLGQSPGLMTAQDTPPLAQPTAVQNLQGPVLPTAAHTPRGPAARPPFMPSSSTSTDYNGIGVGQDEGDDPDEDDPYADDEDGGTSIFDPATDIPSTSTLPAPSVSGPDVGGPRQGPAPVAGQAGFSGQTFPDSQHMQDWDNGKLRASWTLKPHGDPSIPQDWVKDPTPTAKAGAITYQPPQQNPDGSVTQQASNGRVVSVKAAPRATAAKDKWKTINNPDGSVWQVNETTNQLRQVKAATKPSTTVTWSPEQQREDGSTYQVSSTGQIRQLKAAPKAPAIPRPQVVGNRVLEYDPQQGRYVEVYKAPDKMRIEKDETGNILGINEETGEVRTIYEDPAGREAASLKNAKSRQDLIPQATVSGGNVIVPYGAEATLQDYDPMTGQSSTRHMGKLMIPPEAQGQTQQRALPPPVDRAPAPDEQPAYPADVSPPGVAGTAADPMHAPESDSPYPPEAAGFAQPSEAPAEEPAPDEPAPEDQPEEDPSLGDYGDMGMGADIKQRVLGSSLQSDLGRDIPTYKKRRKRKSAKGTFLTQGLSTFTGAGQDEPNPADAWLASQGAAGDMVSDELRMKRAEGVPVEAYGPEMRYLKPGGIGEHEFSVNQSPAGGSISPWSTDDPESAPRDFRPFPYPYNPAYHTGAAMRMGQIAPLHGEGGNPEAAEADLGRAGFEGSWNTGGVDPSLTAQREGPQILDLGGSHRPGPWIPTGMGEGPQIFNVGGGHMPGPNIIQTGPTMSGFPGAGQDEQPMPPVAPQDAMGMGHKFGQPLDSGEPLHKGTDIQAVKGTPVWAPVDGVVRIENNPQGLGLQVKIIGVDGQEHGLGHLASVAVQDGQHVRKGQNVGKVGDTGKTTGAHLDYRQRTPDGGFNNPEPDLGGMAEMPPVPGTEMMGAGAGWQPKRQVGWIPPGAGAADDSPDAFDRTAAAYERRRFADYREDPYQTKQGMDPSGPYSIYSSGSFGRQVRTRPPKDRWWADEGVGAGGEGGMGAGAQYTVALPEGGFKTVNASDPAAARENAGVSGDAQVVSGGHQAHQQGGVATAGSGPSDDGGTQIGITPYDKARLDNEAQQIRNALNSENNRHGEELQRLQQQAQQEADWRSVQQAVNAENNRHNLAVEGLQQRQQDLDLQLEKMREAQQTGMFGRQARMDILGSALKNPWLQKLSGMAPRGDPGGAVGGGNIQQLINMILGGTGGPDLFGAPTNMTAPAGQGAAPDWNTWQQWSPFQKAAWRTNLEAAGPGAFEQAQSGVQGGWGAQANPNVSQLAGATADAAGTAGMEMTANMFGETEPDFWSQQNKQWSKAQAPNVKQSTLAGYGSPYTVG